MRHSWARQRASDGFQSAEDGASPWSAYQSVIFSMMLSRVQRVTRRPPANCTDGVIETLRPSARALRGHRETVEAHASTAQVAREGASDGVEDVGLVTDHAWYGKV